MSDSTPIGRLGDVGPYRPWCLNVTRGWPWGICGASGWNCVGGLGGIVFLASYEVAEAMIRSHGYEPGEVRT